MMKADDETDEQPDTTDMTDLENEESAERRRKHERQGLNILTPERIISRLPIYLAHIKAGNNPQKLKNDIRNLLYSLYRSKTLSKTICNSLMNTI